LTSTNFQRRDNLKKKKKKETTHLHEAHATWNDLRGRGWKEAERQKKKKVERKKLLVFTVDLLT